jgi:hypothetical protein
MEKFILKGSSKSDTSAFMFLDLPTSKRFDVIASKNVEKVLQPKLLIEKAISRGKCESSHVRPCAVVEGRFEDLPGTLRHLHGDHPYPVSQGPLVLPIDSNISPKRPEWIVFRKKTQFRHIHSQKCLEWASEVTGTTAWSDKENIFLVSDVVSRIQGPASTRDMRVLYTCHMSSWSGCVIPCPCSICTKTREHCIDLHKSEVCEECSSQCTTHKIKLLRLFNPVTDHFTIVTEKINKYRFAHGYAGIPTDCESCSEDVLEHQCLHLVFHARCRFCRYDMRPMLDGAVITLTDYIEEDNCQKQLDEKTCSCCLLVSQNKLSRIKHEAVVHEKTEQKYRCEKCEKSYSNINALVYHTSKHEEFAVMTKHVCALCGKQFSSSGSLDKHNQIKHGEFVESHQCELCPKKFAWKTGLNRHKREQHYDKMNVDFHEGGSGGLENFTCDQCKLEFKRNYDLKRHLSSAHSDIKFDCSFCDKTFSRKDIMIRHVKAKHNKMSDS